MEQWSDVLKELVAASPYAIFVVLAFAGACFMYKISAEALHRSVDKTIKEIRDAYANAYKNR